MVKAEVRALGDCSVEFFSLGSALIDCVRDESIRWELHRLIRGGSATKNFWEMTFSKVGLKDGVELGFSICIDGMERDVKVRLQSCNVVEAGTDREGTARLLCEVAEGRVSLDTRRKAGECVAYGVKAGIIGSGRTRLAIGYAYGIRESISEYYDAHKVYGSKGIQLTVLGPVEQPGQGEDLPSTERYCVQCITQHTDGQRQQLT